MGTFKLDDKTKKQIEKAGREEANRLANDAEKKLINKYVSLLNDYYEDYTPRTDKNGVPYYNSTFNLYKSYRAYKMNPHNTIVYGGVDITSDRMDDYHSITGETFSAQRLLDKYIYTSTLPSATWHGGNWNGGYGILAKFSIYDEMMKYKNFLIDYYTKNYGI